VKLSRKEGEFLVKLARKAIIHFLKTNKQLSVPPDNPLTLKGKRGVFVTLKKATNGVENLRGCIGYPEPVFPLAEAIIKSAISAATQDPRFPPISLREINDVVTEISVLTPPMLVRVNNPIEYVKKITIGTDGLIVERGMFKGLLLPQVPIEWKWDQEEFLSNCCMKAGLRPDAWLLKDTKIYTFQAIVFKENVPNGKVELVELI
jgi:uncharacterized protein (TIGR00296 family)